jgi:hypothetical protein
LRQGQPPVLLNCITFAAPPIFSTNITPGLKALLSARSFSVPSVFIAFAIEGDPFVRLDTVYARFLLDLLNEKVATPPRPPSLSLYMLGDVVMFRKVSSPSGEMNVYAYSVEGGVRVLERKVFVDFEMHRMMWHERCVALGIRDGRSINEVEERYNGRAAFGKSSVISF